MAGVEVLYTTTETKTINVLGIDIKIKTLTGYDYLKLTERSRNGMDINRATYAKDLIGACVVEPPIEIGKLKTSALILLVSKIEDALGVSEVVQKNLSPVQMPK